MSSKFIVIAGQAANGHGVLANLPLQGNGLVITHEPGGTPFFEKLRELLMKDVATSNRQVVRHLIKAGRIDHEEQVIRPALLRGDHVICNSLEYTMLAGMDTPEFVHEESLLHAAFTRDGFVEQPTLFIILVHNGMDQRLRTVFGNIARKMNSGITFRQTEIIFVDATRIDLTPILVAKAVNEHLGIEQLATV